MLNKESLRLLKELDPEWLTFMVQLLKEIGGESIRLPFNRPGDGLVPVITITLENPNEPAAEDGKTERLHSQERERTVAEPEDVSEDYLG